MIFKNQCKDKKMKNILITLSILILFISCNHVSKKNSIKIKLPENTRSVQYNPQTIIPELPNKLTETSGLIYHDKLLWTLNDSGGKNAIYGFNFNEKITKALVRKKINKVLEGECFYE